MLDGIAGTAQPARSVQPSPREKICLNGNTPRLTQRMTGFWRMVVVSPSIVADAGENQCFEVRIGRSRVQKVMARLLAVQYNFMFIANRLWSLVSGLN